MFLILSFEDCQPAAWSVPKASASTITSSSTPLSAAPQSSHSVTMLGGASAGNGDDAADAAGDDAREFVEDDGSGRFQKLCKDRCWPPL
ncbi:8b21c9bf-edfa-4e67-ac8d-3238b4fd5161 [Thermothielavioides terrestris]|uniref:8b21c9bf-edfa-4e67-ac8d-3238b4fd5161 n=1 Tax=Thermothielavioides terrestris TaxID=2587410 RepID=A0A3S4ATU5_9PEZI|nr:8b21c9bf-edfa-4e67-ac8d-3238b4fd5161 [Thermothielavioides terrestris]